MKKFSVTVDRHMGDVCKTDIFVRLTYRNRTVKCHMSNVFRTYLLDFMFAFMVFFRINFKLCSIILKNESFGNTSLIFN